MRLLWTVLKVVIVIALAIPVAIFVLATSLGILGALLGLAMMTLRIALVGLAIWGVWHLMRILFGGGSPRRAETPAVRNLPPLPPRDPHYEAAMRELDQELGPTR